jgi:hypothetical protein
MMVGDDHTLIPDSTNRREKKWLSLEDLFGQAVLSR